MRAVTMVGGVQYERVLAVEAAVSDFGLQWLPWRGEVQGAAEAPAPLYGALVPEAYYAYDVERGDAGDLERVAGGKAVRRSGVLARLGLLCGLRSLALTLCSQIVTKVKKCLTYVSKHV